MWVVCLFLGLFLPLLESCEAESCFNKIAVKKKPQPLKDVSQQWGTWNPVCAIGLVMKF